MRKEDEVLSGMWGKDGGRGMKLTIEKNGSTVKAIKAEYTPVEWLAVEDAMRRYTKDREVNVVDRLIAQQILSVEPEEEESEVSE